MKQIISVRSNLYFEQDPSEFKISPMMELVVIVANGKKYKVKDNKLGAKTKFKESRMLVSPEMLEEIITNLKLQQKNLEVSRNNAEQINSLIKHIES